MKRTWINLQPLVFRRRWCGMIDLRFQWQGVGDQPDLIQTVCREYPQLRQRLPKKRRAWDEEPYSTALFAAAARLFTFSGSVVRSPALAGALREAVGNLPARGAGGESPSSQRPIVLSERLGHSPRRFGGHPRSGRALLIGLGRAAPGDQPSSSQNAVIAGWQRARGSRSPRSRMRATLCVERLSALRPS